jgi:apolipoprotein N-acyltransferase
MTSPSLPVPYPTRTRWGLAILSGLLLGLAFPPTGLGGGLLAFMALVPLLLALEPQPGLRQTFRTTFIAMFVLGLVSNYWVGGWKATGDVDPFLMLGGVLLAVVHPFFLVVPWLLFDIMRRRFSERIALYSLPVFYAGFEYWHSFGDLSYPWLSLYNTQTYNLPFVQFIEFTGPFALSMLLVLINVEIFQLWRYRTSVKEQIPHAGVLALLLALPYAYGAFAMNSAEESHASLRVTVVQPNINPWAKWQTDEQRILDTNFAASMSALSAVEDSSDLLVWPETAITFYITAPAKVYELRQLYQFLQTTGKPLLTGFPDREEYQEGRDPIPTDATPEQAAPGWYYRSWNAAMLLYRSNSGEIQRERYHKQKLVPLGEHVPFVDVFPVLGSLFRWGVGLGSWNVGSGHQPLRMPLAHAPGDTLRVVPLICYESVYPSFVRQFVREGANMLAVITNDGWYGKSSGPYQHNQFAVLRAIENRRWIVRSANTGISTVIDDRGRFLASLPLFESGSLTQRVPLIERKTAYVQWGDYIAIPSLGYCCLAIGYAWITWFQRRRRRLTTATPAAETMITGA